MTDISLRWREIRGVHKGYLNLEFRQLAFLTALNYPYAKSLPATQSNFLRMTVTNLHLGDDVRIEGEDSEDRVVTSQPFYDGHDEEHIDSDNMRIARVLTMAELGFSPDDIPGDPPGASGAYRKPGYLILDAVWHHFIYRLHKDTVSAIPFDLQISRDIRRPDYHMGELDQFTEDDPDTGNPKSFCTSSNLS